MAKVEGDCIFHHQLLTRWQTCFVPTCRVKADCSSNGKTNETSVYAGGYTKVSFSVCTQSTRPYFFHDPQPKGSERQPRVKSAAVYIFRIAYAIAYIASIGRIGFVSCYASCQVQQPRFHAWRTYLRRDFVWLSRALRLINPV